MTGTRWTADDDAMRALDDALRDVTREVDDEIDRRRLPFRMLRVIPDCKGCGHLVTCHQFLTGQCFVDGCDCGRMT